MNAEAQRGAALDLRSLLLLMLAAVAILAPGISSLPPVDRDEPRYETATTQMLKTGDFVDIRYQDQPRYLQPAGVYWLQAIPTALFSAPGHRSVWTYRLPSLIGALLAVLITTVGAGRLFGRQVGDSALECSWRRVCRWGSRRGSARPTGRSWPRLRRRSSR